MTSYFEGWSPFNRTVLPNASSAAGPFTDNGYKFWTPQSLGGWAMVSGDAQAVAMVFGKTEYGYGKKASDPRCVFNRNDYGAKSGVTTLLPGVESDWPDYSTIVQHLAIVPGAPADVQQRA